MNRKFKKQQLNKVAQWWKHGETGLSSEAIVLHVIADISVGDYPSDPSDFRRCVVMMEKLPFIRTYFVLPVKGTDTETYAPSFSHIFTLMCF